MEQEKHFENIITIFFIDFKESWQKQQVFLAQNYFQYQKTTSNNTSISNNY